MLNDVELYACAGLHTKYIRILKILLMELGFVYMHEHNALSGEKNKGTPVIKTRKKICALMPEKTKTNQSSVCLAQHLMPSQTCLKDGEPRSNKQKTLFTFRGREGGAG